MRLNRHTAIVLIIILFILSGIALRFAHQKFNTRTAGAGVETPADFRMSDRIATLNVEAIGDDFVFHFKGKEGERVLTSKEFAAELAHLQQKKQDSGWLFRVLDITSMNGVMWVLLGFAGQFLFTGRMLVQWIASERAKKSVVPPAFWWMSLMGSSLLILYFWWRVDVVGILGQTTGWIVYIRNLWLLQKQIEKQG